MIAGITGLIPVEERRNGRWPITFSSATRAETRTFLKLSANLKRRGVPVWLDQWDIPPSADWDLTIDNALYDRRVTFGAILVGLVVAIVLFVVAFRQFQGRQAEAQIALSHELASAAIDNLDVDPELGLLLAVKAIETEYTVQSEDALRQAVASPWRATLRGHTSSANSVAYSPDGRWIVTASYDGTARVWPWPDVEGLLAAARSRVARELTCQERVQYLHEDLDCGAEE